MGRFFLRLSAARKINQSRFRGAAWKDCLKELPGAAGLDSIRINTPPVIGYQPHQGHHRQHHLHQHQHSHRHRLSATPHRHRLRISHTNATTITSTIRYFIRQVTYVRRRLLVSSLVTSLHLHQGTAWPWQLHRPCSRFRGLSSTPMRS